MRLLKAILKFLLRRISVAVATVFVVTVLIFLLVRMIPGDPVAAAFSQTGEFTKAQLDAFRKEMGLDKSWPEQYLLLIWNLLHGRAGTSAITFRDSMIDVLYYFPATLELTLLAMTLAFTLGVMFGITAGLTNRKVFDNFLSFWSISGLSYPNFLVAILLQVVVANTLGWFPLTGRIEPGFEIQRVTGLMLLDTLLAGNIRAFWSALRSLVLPAATLAFAPSATLMRLIRANTIREKNKSYIAALRANGLPRSLLIWRYLLPNAVGPALTMAGIQFANTLGGSFVIETIFMYPGNGWLGTGAMISKDINMIQAVTLLISVYFVISNLLVDFLHTYIDPRIRLKEVPV